jgi:hypothetical protein
MAIFEACIVSACVCLVPEDEITTTDYRTWSDCDWRILVCLLSVVWEKDLLTKFVSSNYLFEITPELMLGLEQYVTEHFKPIYYCNGPTI